MRLRTTIGIWISLTRPFSSPTLWGLTRWPGRAVQVDPIKPTVKAPGSKRLKLKCDEPLSNFAFKFNMRPYNLESAAHVFVPVRYRGFHRGRAVQAHSIKTRLESTCGFRNQRLKL